jgi:hypothetical protein
LTTPGALFDAKGNLKNWWTPQDMAQFKARSQALAAQYSAYEPLPGLHLNGNRCWVRTSPTSRAGQRLRRLSPVAERAPKRR